MTTKALREACMYSRYCNQDLFGDGMDGAGRQNRVWAGLDATVKRPHLPSTSDLDMSMLLSLACLAQIPFSWSSRVLIFEQSYFFLKKKKSCNSSYYYSKGRGGTETARFPLFWNFLLFISFRRCRSMVLNLPFFHPNLRHPPKKLSI